MLLSREELARHAPGRPCAVTVGVFDGVHLGHRHLIDAMKARAVKLAQEVPGVVSVQDRIQVASRDKPAE